MKKVEEMTIGDIERYLKRVEKARRTFGKSYRIFWPFDIFSPFSPTRLMLDIGVLCTWFFVCIWFIFRQHPEKDLVIYLVNFWIIILVFSFFIAIVERHYRIKIRYRILTMHRNYQQTQQAASSPPPQDQSQQQHHQQHSQSTKTSGHGQQYHTHAAYGYYGDRDLIDIAKEFLRKILR